MGSKANWVRFLLLFLIFLIIIIIMMNYLCQQFYRDSLIDLQGDTREQE